MFAAHNKTLRSKLHLVSLFFVNFFSKTVGLESSDFRVVATGKNLKTGEVRYGQNQGADRNNLPERLQTIFDTLPKSEKWPIGNCAEAHVQAQFGNNVRTQDIVMSNVLRFKNGWVRWDSCTYCQPFYPHGLSRPPMFVLGGGSLIPPSA